MIGWIVVGIFLGMFLKEAPIIGALFGGFGGWLAWKVSSLEGTIQSLQNHLQQLSPQENDKLVKTSKIKKDTLSSRLSVKLPEEALSTSISKYTQPLKMTTSEAIPSRMEAPTKAEIKDRTSWGSNSGSAKSSRNDFEPKWQQAIDRFSAKFEGILAWFVNGNMLVRIGSVVLFFGAGFLLKYAAEHSHLSIEIRMLGIVLGACVMLGVGWYLRSSRPVYALALQGGGLGLLYLTIYASFRLYDLLVASHALMLLAFIAGAGVAMAVVHNARWLAILSFAGGFLAPVLASTGSGSHVTLFSWYAVLNVGIAILAWHKAWRSLNLLGMVATFIIAALWGNQYYRLSFYDSVEPFLIGFGLMYLAVGVLFSLHRADPEQEGFGRVDASIVFGTPVGFFLLQTPLVHHFEHGMSLSALLAGLVYMGAAWLAHRKKNRILMMSLLSIGVTLLTLAIPLEFNETETAAAWAMEGVGLLWLGLAQKSGRALLVGMLLQGLAASSWLLGSPLNPSAGYGLTLSAFLIAFSGWGCAIVLGQHSDWRRCHSIVEKFLSINIEFGFQIWGLLWWLIAGLTELHRHLHDYDMLLSTIAWLTLSAWLVEGLGLRVRWEEFRRLNVGLFFLWLILLLIQSDYATHPAQGWGALIWLCALATTIWMLYREDKQMGKTENIVQSTEGSRGVADYHVFNPFHIAGVCFVLSLLIWEAHWQVSERLSIPMGMPLWADLVFGIITALLLMAISLNNHRWPVMSHRTSYLQVSAVICLLVLGGWFVWMLQEPVHTPFPYLPILNPLDLTVVLGSLAIYSWWKALKQQGFVWFEMWQLYLVVGSTAFIWLNIDIARVVHHWFAISWNERAMMHSVEFQAGLSLCWSILALLLMSWASKQRLRSFWIGGATLLAAVVIKLFAVDMSGTGTLARIISFLGVGGLLLVIGYLSPLPPESTKSTVRDGEGKEGTESEPSNNKI